MQVSLRQADRQDFEYCERLYFAAMEKTIRQFGIDMSAHAVGFRQQWEPTQVRIITLDGRDVGWLQSMTQGDALFLGQLFVEGPFQGQGIGTAVMDRIIDESARVGQAVTLGVVKTNPALRLYERLGFQVTHEDERKFYMRREPDTGASRLS